MENTTYKELGTFYLLLPFHVVIK